LLELLDEFKCHNIIFSSSATVYGSAKELPLTEQSSVGVGITNPYGRSKFMLEEILRDFYYSKEGPLNDWSVVLLRYFNPIGAHASGLIGEDPNGTPNNLMPYITQVAIGTRDHLTVFGSDYPTRDGTGVRDYIHVMDLAQGHLSAMDYNRKKGPGCFTFNLGTGRGYSVLETIHAMEKASGKTIVYELGPRRRGDIAECYADPSLATVELGWAALRGIDEMCRDSWTWQSHNPKGYRDQIPDGE
jgi:UDP-glucose 4-epimerase